MDKQRELMNQLVAAYSERLNADGARLTLDLEGQKTLLPAEVADAIEQAMKINARLGRIQSEAILSAVAEVIARNINSD